VVSNADVRIEKSFRSPPAPEPNILGSGKKPLLKDHIHDCIIQILALFKKKRLIFIRAGKFFST
jgi:hypothetical protein